jgi:hypothetical protein
VNAQVKPTTQGWPPFVPGDIGYLRNKLLPVELYEYSEEEAIELARCRDDICYFAEKYFTIVSLDFGKILIPLFDYQKTLLVQLQEERFNIVLQARQSGKTTVNTILILHYALFNKDKFVAILANKEKAAKMVLARIKMAFEIMPRFLKQRVKEWNKTKIQFHNGCTIEAAATSATSIRGESVNMLYIDEAAFVENWEEFYASTYSTITAGSEEIPMADRTKIILNSTANGLNHFYHIYQGAQANRPMENTVPVEGVTKNRFVPFEVSYHDVPGRDENWRERTIDDTTEEQFMQEHENHFLGGQNTLIRPGILNALVVHAPEHLTGEMVKIYKLPEAGHDYVVTVDTSHGKGLDYHAFSVFDITRYPFEQVASFRDNELSTLLYPNVIHVTAVQYNEAYILCENNDLGAMVVADLNYDMEYENLLSPKNIVARENRAYELGVRMTASVKSIGCSNLRDMLENHKLVTHDKATITELSTFVAKGKSYEADPKVLGSTDDMAITLVMFAWLTTTALFTDIFDNKMLKRDLFKQRIEEIEQGMLPSLHLDDGLDSVGESTTGTFDAELGMYEVSDWDR